MPKRKGFNHPKTMPHPADLRLRYRFVDRGGRYVYEIHSAPVKGKSLLLGIARVAHGSFIEVDWDEQAKAHKPETRPLPIIGAEEESA